MSRRPNFGVLVKLTCGCKTQARIAPLPGARLGCSSGLGHGYRLDWVWAEANGKTSYQEKPIGKETKG